MFNNVSSRKIAVIMLSALSILAFSAISASAATTTVKADVTAQVGGTPPATGFNEDNGYGLDWSKGKNKILEITIHAPAGCEIKCADKQVISEGIAWKNDSFDQWKTSHTYQSALITANDYYRPLFSGEIRGGQGGVGGGPVVWKAGVIQVDIQADADNDSKEPQRPPSTKDAERKREEIAEQGGTDNPTGLLVSVNRGFHEFKAGMSDIYLPDNEIDGITIDDPELIKANIVLKLPEEVIPGSTVRLTYSKKLRVYKVVNNAATLIESRKDYDVASFGVSNTVLIEGIKPSDSVGSDSIKVVLTPKTGRVARDYLAITVFQVLIDVDANNDGTVEVSNYGEDRHGNVKTGRIITLDDPDEVGKDPTKSDVAEVHIGIYPKLPYGKIQLAWAISKLNITAWQDRNKTQKLKNLPDPWDLSKDQMPAKFYVSGISAGPSNMWLGYYPPSRMNSKAFDDSIAQDVAAVHVVDPISRAPLSNSVVLWQSDDHLSDDPGKEIKKHVLEAGTDAANVWWVKDSNYSDNNVESCTVDNLKLAAFFGIIYVNGHCSGKWIAVAVFPNNESGLKALNEYCDQDPAGLILPRVVWGPTWLPFKTKYLVAGASDAWFAANWQKYTEYMQSIIILGGCNSTSIKMQKSVGGRVQFGYLGIIQSTDDEVYNYNILFGNMSGEYSEGQYRTANAAFGNGQNFKDGFSMTGDGWTTLGPAPILSNDNIFPEFISSPTGTKRKGYGGIIFDTYMDDTFTANAAVQHPYGGKVSTRRWIYNSVGAYGISFDFDLTQGGTIHLNAVADKCTSKALLYNENKKLSGNRETYGKDYEWDAQ